MKNKKTLRTLAIIVFAFAALLFIHQYLFYGVIWEWDEMFGLHHELYIIICLIVGDFIWAVSLDY
jgi:hypothetical protein